MRTWSDVWRGEAAIAGILAAFGIYVTWSGLGMPAGTLAVPGPAVFPIAVGTLLALVSAGILIGAVSSGAEEPPVKAPEGETVVTVLALAGAALLFERIGAGATLVAFLAVLFRAYARRPWWQAALFSLCGASVAWAVFTLLLRVGLPWTVW